MQAIFYRSNRASLNHAIHGGVVVMAAYAQMQRGNDTAFRFEQEANFWWLTGIEAPEWWLICDGTKSKTWLVAPHISEAHEIFEGSMAADTAKTISGADEVITHDKAMDLLHDLAKKHSVVYTLGDQPYSEHLDFTLNPGPKKLHDLLKRTFRSVQDCRKELAQLRAIKQPEEIAAIKKAIATTIEGFETVQATLEDCHHEYEVEAEFSYLFRKNGATGHAYDPIVAAGGNACTLHYVDNSAKLKKRELLLLDVGARVDGYAADITRTYAIGEPTKRQAQVHRAVQTAHQAVIDLLKPDLSVEEYHRQVDEIMKRALQEVGVMNGPADTAAFRKYFPHAISHGLGVDVHDSLGGPKYFKPGMVLTVEPGIYIPEEGIGVRIEDDILITPSGHTNLSARLSTDL